ncbi:hypothetical protein SUNI508_11854 [Seiridium unicorne]|uniref:chitinase n=1 Tax=Seiridium unicorne TaxID=138068 RepID=A0ABR2UG63_9PEZI
MVGPKLAPAGTTFAPFLILFLSLLSLINAQTYYCDADNPCDNGACCGVSDGETQGICGYGDTYCGDTCISNCTATAECGRYAETKGTTCPLNVCCSAYGFCGTTSDFCTQTDDEDTSCQSNCDYPTEPSCSSNDVLKRVIGYYESWSATRVCDSWRPNDIAAGSLTHINYAFALFQEVDDDEWEISWDQMEKNDLSDLISEFVGLKDNNPGLSCFLSIGGWSFNDGDTASYWSDMASTSAGRKSWSKSVLSTMVKYGFDGVDLDWEYPVASDRGGSEEDKDNYVKLIKELRSVFDTSGEAYGITFTIPTSYWYLQHFDIETMVGDSGADWVNVMSYDLHGTWDGNSPWTESVLAAHTNLTEIETAMDLLWRNNVDPSKVVLGMGFYGRSFTMDDVTCSTPGCAWSGAGSAGSCTATEGILSYKEIQELLGDSESVLTYDEDAAVSYLVYETDQWISFDTNKTFQQKVDWANDHCLGGVMIWALDQDTYDWQALSALLDVEVDGSNLLEGGSESEVSQKQLATDYSAYTGASCYVSGCFDSGKGQCKTGYSVLDYVHAGAYGVIEKPDDDLCDVGDEGEGQYRLICCPTEAMPEGCSWSGDDTLYGDGLCAGGTSDFCGTGKFELIQDGWTKRTGGTKCVAGARSLCCNSNTELELCSWTDCMGDCSDDLPYEYKYQSEYAGSNLSPDSETCEDLRIYTLGSTAKFCCPTSNTYKNCEWLADDYCTDTCPSDKVLITERQSIVNGNDDTDTMSCSDGYVKLCCDPPESTTNLPVDPAYLFEYPDDDDVSYYYNVEESNNEDATSDDSEDPFALVMITGDTSAYDESLVDQWTFLDDDSEELSKRDTKGKAKKRDLFTNNGDTFSNVVETHRIKCNSPLRYGNETGCQSIFKGGARNTIVKMPDHVGAGPYARVVSLERVASNKRDTTEEEYELTTDYDLAAAAEEEKGAVNFRIDYTNLLEYWDEITDTPAERRRWFGDFSGWLKKMTTITKKEDGSLPLEYEDNVKLLHFQKYCPKLDLNTTLDLDANIHIGLYSQYGYYFEGSILPTPELISAYGYFSIEPAAAILMTLRGEATIQTSSDTVNIISGIGLPGLSIKGLISIGPELDLTGSMDASLSVSGEINAGVSMGFDKTTVYFPNTEDAASDDAEPGSDGDNALTDSKHTYSFEPVLDASLTATGNMALHLTPEVKFGISVLGGQLMEGYVKAGITNTIEMGISASASTSTSGDSSAEFCYWADYSYRLFIAADISFIDDLAYWGGDYDVYSSDDPLTLVEETCATYSSSDKRRRSTSLVANAATNTGCFGGYISCSTTDDDDAMDICTTDDESDESEIDDSCTSLPSLFYNCDYMGASQTFDNLNEDTMGRKADYTFISICENIRNYLNNAPATTPSGQTVVSGASWMQLTYNPGKDSTNRKKACGSNKVGDKASSCASTKSAMWPTAVYNAAKKKDKAYKKMAGYSDTISCDEFPFNASEEGGSGAQAECVPSEYQFYQGRINQKIRSIVDTTTNTKWKDSDWSKNSGGKDRKYLVSLIDGGSSTNGENSYLGKYAGSVDKDSDWTIDWIIGGINLMGNSDYSLPVDNCLCRVKTSTAKEVSDGLKVSMWAVTNCVVTFVDPEDLTKRGLDPKDANNWIVKNATLSEGWKRTAFYPDGTPLLDDDETDENAADARDDSTSPPAAMITEAPDLELAEEAVHPSLLLHYAHGISSL